MARGACTSGLALPLRLKRSRCQVKAATLRWSVILWWRGAGAWSSNDPACASCVWVAFLFTPHEMNRTRAKNPARKVAKTDRPFTVLDNRISQRSKLHFVPCLEAPLKRSFLQQLNGLPWLLCAMDLFCCGGRSQGECQSSRLEQLLASPPDDPGLPFVTRRSVSHRILRSTGEQSMPDV